MRHSKDGKLMIGLDKDSFDNLSPRLKKILPLTLSNAGKEEDESSCFTFFESIDLRNVPYMSNQEQNEIYAIDETIYELAQTPMINFMHYEQRFPASLLYLYKINVNDAGAADLRDENERLTKENAELRLKLKQIAEFATV